MLFWFHTHSVLLAQHSEIHCQMVPNLLKFVDDLSINLRTARSLAE